MVAGGKAQQERDPRPHLGQIDEAGGVIRLSPARSKTRWWGGFSRSHNPLPRRSRDGGHAATPTARSSSTATASPSAAGARRGALPVRRPVCRSAFSTITGAAARTLIRARVPERVACYLRGGPGHPRMTRGRQRPTSYSLLRCRMLKRDMFRSYALIGAQARLAELDRERVDILETFHGA